MSSFRRGKRLDFICARFDGCGFAVDIRIRVMRLDETDMVKQKFVTAGGAEPVF